MLVFVGVGDDEADDDAEDDELDETESRDVRVCIERPCAEWN